MIKRQITYCSRYFPESVPKLIEQLLPYLESGEKEFHHTSGFAHSKMVIFTNSGENKMEMAHWGLIPSWVKDKISAEKFWNNTINARSETMFEKASFKDSAKHKRCILFVDGFYEHHHQNSKAYPFFIHKENNEMLALAGLWTDWLDKESGELRKTFSILTTKANSLMNKIHNNPKLKEARMPVLLSPSNFLEWMDNKTKESRVVELCTSAKEGVLKAYTVKRLRGKEYLGNVPEISEAHTYHELSLILD